MLKDIVIPNLPSPYYHFEYDQVGNAISDSLASDFNVYDIVYSGNKISEMRNNTAANKDRLQYIYDENDKPGVIKYITETGTLYRRAYLRAAV